MDRAMNADMLERAGYGVTLSRIEELGKKYTKTQEEQDELAILKTICDRYTGNLVSILAYLLSFCLLARSPIHHHPIYFPESSGNGRVSRRPSS